MGKKIELDETYVVNEYLKGKSSLILEKELRVSKPVILNILNKYGVIRKRDRCKSINFIKQSDKYVILKKCPKCENKIKISSADLIIACRNYFNSINKNTLCNDCRIKSQTGDGNSFYGKKYSETSKLLISNSRKGKGMGLNNSMSNPVWKKKATDNLKKRWDSGELEYVRKIMSDKLTETRRMGKIKSVIRSKKEKEIVNEIKMMGYDVDDSFKIDTKIYDIYVPILNLIIEYNGDYWHCNPKKYSEDYFHQNKGKTAKEIWDYDNTKIDIVKSKGYILEIVWESDLKIDPTLIKKIITKYERKN